MTRCIYGLVCMAVAAGLALASSNPATSAPVTMSTARSATPLRVSPTASTTYPATSVSVAMTPERSSTPLRVSTMISTEKIMAPTATTLGELTATTLGELTAATSPTVTCRDVDVNCAYLDAHVQICSEPESAKMLCARTCNMCGQGGTVSNSLITSTMRPLVTSTMRPLVTSAYIATGTATENRCNSGFVQCLDGRCEPFESLCEETGIVTTLKPPPMTTSSNGVTLATSAAVSMGTMDASKPEVASTTSMMMQSTDQPTTHQVVTVSAGPNGCADGWERCADDTCEPFHWLCTEHDGTDGVIG